MNPRAHANLPTHTCIEDAPTPDEITAMCWVIRAESEARFRRKFQGCGGGGELEKVHLSEGRYRIHFGHGKRRARRI